MPWIVLALLVVFVLVSIAGIAGIIGYASTPPRPALDAPQLLPFATLTFLALAFGIWFIICFTGNIEDTSEDRERRRRQSFRFAYVFTLTTLVVPRPIGWISTINRNGVVNLAPYSFFNAVSSRPPFVMFSSAGRKHSQTNAEESGEFVHSLTTWELREEMSITSAEVGADVSEVDLAHLEMAPSIAVKPPRVKRSLRDAGVREGASRSADARGLTAREREVLRLSAEGRSGAVIAERLGISPRTAETHRHNLMQKLGLHSRTELVRFALRHGLLPPE